MTKREFLEMVIEESANAEVKAFAESEIVKMNERNAKRSGETSDSIDVAALGPTPDTDISSLKQLRLNHLRQRLRLPMQRLRLPMQKVRLRKLRISLSLLV